MTLSDLTGRLRRFGKSRTPALWSHLARARRFLLNQQSSRRVFARIHRKNAWDGTTSVSGPGSTLDQTVTVRRVIPQLLQERGIRRLLDVPCGDLGWMQQVDVSGVAYLGGDIVPEMVERNRAKYGSRLACQVIDLARTPLPEADLLLCRDCLVHLPIKLIGDCFANMKRSRIEFVLTTTYVLLQHNIDIEVGGWRPLNLQKPPFNFPAPLELHREIEAPDGGLGKSLALWRIAEIPDVFGSAGFSER